MASLSPSSSSTTSTCSSSSSSDTDISPPTSPRTRIAFPSLAFSKTNNKNSSGGIATVSLKSPPSPPTVTDFTSTTEDVTSTFPSSSTRTPKPPLSPTSSGSGSAPLFSTHSPYAHCAYPSWPRSDILSPLASSSSNNFSSSSSSILSADSYNFPTPPSASSAAAATSYISDEDLLDLATLPLYNNIRIPPEFLVAATPLSSDLSSQKERRRPRSQRVVLPVDVQRGASVPVAASKGGVDEEGLKGRSTATTSMMRRRRSSPLKRRKLVLGLSPVVEGAE